MAKVIPGVRLLERGSLITIVIITIMMAIMMTIIGSWSEVPELLNDDGNNNNNSGDQNNNKNSFLERRSLMTTVTIIAIIIITMMITLIGSWTKVPGVRFLNNSSKNNKNDDHNK